MTAGTITCYKNNVSQGVMYSSITGTIGPWVQRGGGGNHTFWMNFGQQPFVYTAPSGFLALNTYNL